MSTLTAPAPTPQANPAFIGLLTATPGNLPPAVELARQCCTLLLRACYDWQKAIVTPSYDLGQEGLPVAPDQYVTVLVPSRLPSGSDFLFELVQEAHSGHWRMCYAYGKTLTELSPSQEALASTLLTKHTGSGQIMPYWE